MDGHIQITSATNLTNQFNAGRDALRVRVSETSANFFALLGAKNGLGRALASDEDKPGQAHVAVISHRMWQQAYGEDRAVLGATVHLNGTPLTIVGVAQPRFDYPDRMNVWIPTDLDFETVPKHGAFLWQTIRRLTPGASHVSPDSFRRDDHQIS